MEVDAMPKESVAERRPALKRPGYDYKAGSSRLR